MAMNDFGAVEHLVPGAVGQPGDRAFYLEIASDTGTRWYLLEKTQVAALAAHGHDLLATAGLSGAGGDLSVPPFSAPDIVEFRVGELHLRYSEETGSIELTLISVEDDSDRHRYALMPGQLDVAGRIGLEAVAAGRPRCPRCGLAKDPEGHVCPASNGDLRNHRP
jgi:uncharacterized repeat protein (TIGR03847 family)